ncbi:DUF6418 domain-containing protein [Siminovitchia sp. FSL H7-0308]|uniref:DUF6418 domain-containing protein n=1 Tax=Siminovitchia sp. FSL H7-0308 TaxID=2921432 RepID=UPI0030ED48BF
MIRLSKVFIFVISILACLIHSNILAIASFVIYLFYIFIKDKKFILKYFYVVFLVTTNILGVFIIESTYLYLFEVGQWTSKANSLGPIVIVHLLFLETLFFVDGIYKNKQANLITRKSFSDTFFILAAVFSIAILFYLFLKVIDKPYFIFEYDRFAYQQNILSPLDAKLGNLFLYLMPIFYFLLIKYRKLGLIVIALYNIYFIWIGHKFSIFIMAFQIGLLAVYQYIPTNKLRGYIVKVGIVMSLFIGIVTIQNVLVRDFSIENNIAYLQQRLAQQGQLWWAVYKEKEFHEMHLAEAGEELSLFFKPKADENEKAFDLGMFKIMKLVAPENIVQFKIQQDSRFAFSTQSSILYYFNYPTLLLMTILIAALFSVLTNTLIQYINEGNFINTILLSKLYITYVRFISNSDFHTIFSLEVICILFLIAFVNLLLKLRRRKYQIKSPVLY